MQTTYREFVLYRGFTNRSAHYRFADIFDSLEIQDWSCYYVLCRCGFSRSQVYYFLLRFCRLLGLKRLGEGVRFVKIAEKVCKRKSNVKMRLAILFDELSVPIDNNLIFKNQFTIKQLHELALDILEREKQCATKTIS